MKHNETPWNTMKHLQLQCFCSTSLDKNDRFGALFGDCNVNRHAKPQRAWYQSIVEDDGKLAIKCIVFSPLLFRFLHRPEFQKLNQLRSFEPCTAEDPSLFGVVERQIQWPPSAKNRQYPDAQNGSNKMTGWNILSVEHDTCKLYCATENLHEIELRGIHSIKTSLISELWRPELWPCQLILFVGQIDIQLHWWNDSTLRRRAEWEFVHLATSQVALGATTSGQMHQTQLVRQRFW